MSASERPTVPVPPPAAPSLARVELLLDAQQAEITRLRRVIDRDIARRERPRHPDGTADTSRVGAGWGRAESERRAALAGASRGLADAVDGIVRARAALVALAEVDARDPLGAPPGGAP